MGDKKFNRARPNFWAICWISRWISVIGLAMTAMAAAADLPDRFDPARDALKDLQIAKKMAQAEKKRILLDVGGEWCVWCKRMDRLFKEQANLAKLRDQYFVWLKVNYSPENKNEALLNNYPKIKGYPHIFVLDAEGKLLHSQETSQFEAGKDYDPALVEQFLKNWYRPL